MSDDIGMFFMLLLLLGWVISLRLAIANQRSMRDEMPELFSEDRTLD